MKKTFPYLALAVCFAAQNIRADDETAAYARANSFARRTEGKVFRDTVTPHWQPDNQHFWYRVTTGSDSHEFVLVNAETGEIKRADSPEKLGLPESERVFSSSQRSRAPRRTTRTGPETAIRLHNTTSGAVDIFWVDESGEHRPYGRLRPGETKEFHTYTGHVWLVTDSLGNSLGFFEATSDVLEVDVDGKRQAAEPGARPRRNRRGSAQSPDGKFSVRFENNNVVLAPESGESATLTTNGTSETAYRGPVQWSPDAQHCVVFFVHDVSRREVTLVQSSPPDQLQPKLIKYDYFKPGDTLPQVQPVLINVADKTARVIESDLFTNAFTPDGELAVRWSPHSDEFYFDYNQRGHQVYRVLAVNSTSGAVRTVVEERSKTFIDYETKAWRQWLDNTGELIWMSERDGWAHLWLYDGCN